MNPSTRFPNGSPASALSTRIFQIYYADEQIPHLDPAFVPYDNSADKSPLLEFNVFRNIAASGLAESAGLWGAVSWKFTQKTRVTGHELLRVIEAHPGYDVYFCNPFPETEALYPNLWCQGETSHPEFLSLSHDFLQASGLTTRLLDEILPSGMFATANYFVATPDFWHAYLTFIQETLDKAEAGLLPAARTVLFSSLADPRGMHARATYLPFIVERLFSVFLAASAARFKAFKYAAISPESRFNEHVRTIREIKDKAIFSKDKELLRYWNGYRNCYLMLVHRQRWIAQFQHAIMPRKAFLCRYPMHVACQTQALAKVSPHNEGAG